MASWLNLNVTATKGGQPVDAQAWLNLDNVVAVVFAAAAQQYTVFFVGGGTRVLNATDGGVLKSYLDTQAMLASRIAQLQAIP